MKEKEYYSIRYTNDGVNVHFMSILAATPRQAEAKFKESNPTAKILSTVKQFKDPNPYYE